MKWLTLWILIPACRGSNPLQATISKIKAGIFSCLIFIFGWGTWIRTREMADSESAALPLGYTPMCLFILPQGGSQNKHEFEKIRRQPHDTGCPSSNHDPPYIPYHIYPGSGQRFMASRNRSVANQ